MKEREREETKRKVHDKLFHSRVEEEIEENVKRKHEAGCMIIKGSTERNEDEKSGRRKNKELSCYLLVRR